MKTLIATLIISVFFQPAFAGQDQDVQLQGSNEQVAQDVTDRILFHCDFILKKFSAADTFTDEGNLRDPNASFPYKTQQYCADALDGLTQDDDIRPYLTPEGLAWYEDLQDYNAEADEVERTTTRRQSFFGREKVRFDIAPADMPKFIEL